MTDADVDGLHIRTLILTFFYRHMQEVVDRGWLYIAQPPLYKVKRGKKEQYLKDEEAMDTFLLREGTADAKIAFDGGAEISGDELRSWLGDVDRYSRGLKLIDHHFDARVVDSALRLLPDTDVDAAIKDEKAAKSFAERLEAYLLEFEPEVQPLEIKVSPDRERGCGRIEIQSHQGGRPRTTLLDGETIHLPEFHRVRKAYEKVLKPGAGPYTYSFGGEVLSSSERSQNMLEAVRTRGGKGVVVQRYKGLGEMNPDQLWETTMDPTNRVLLRVEAKDAIAADEMFTVLMGDEVKPRREFIEEHALSARNLDI